MHFKNLNIKHNIWFSELYFFLGPGTGLNIVNTFFKINYRKTNIRAYINAIYHKKGSHFQLFGHIYSLQKFWLTIALDI